MKSIILGGLLILLLLLPIGCTEPEVTPTPAPGPEVVTPTSTPEPEVVIPTPEPEALPPEIPAAPSPEVLAEEGFMLPEIPRITCEELKQSMDNEVDFVLVDTRFKISFKDGHLIGAINIPDTPLPPLTLEMIEAKLLELPRDKLIILYCD